MRGASTKKLYILISFIWVLFPVNNIYPMLWEVAIKAMDANGNADSVMVTIYTMNPITHDLEYFRHGYTRTTYYVDNDYNGAFDINDSNFHPEIMDPLPGGSIVTYFLRIGNYYYKMHIEGKTGFGDVAFIYDGNTGKLTNEYNNSDFTITGPYSWKGYDIKVINDFGSDRNICVGNIYFNSQLEDQVGISGKTFNRKGGTFPQTARIFNNQNIQGYNRIWRKWEQNITLETFTFSIEQDATATAYFVKEIGANISAGIGYGYITYNNVTKTLPTNNLHFYEDIDYSITAHGITYDNISYEFDHWEYQGNLYYQNPLDISYPTNTVNLIVRFKGTPLFTESPKPAIRNLSISQIQNVPITLTWSEHPSILVTKYRIYRKVKVNSTWNAPALIETVNRGTTTFVDPDYIYQRGMGNVLMYDVRAYCDSFKTESSELFQGPYNGVLYKQNSKGNDQVVENSINNYPNPFNPVTKISFSIKENGLTKVQVFDILGNKVADLVNEFLTAGSYEAPFDASRLPSGTYIYTIKSNNYSAVKKMLLVK